MDRIDHRMLVNRNARAQHSIDAIDGLREALNNATRGEKGDKGDAGANGAPGSDGAPGADGTDGKTAYESAVTGGYSGTEQQFYADLSAIESLAAALEAL